MKSQRLLVRGSVGVEDGRARTHSVSEVVTQESGNDPREIPRPSKQRRSFHSATKHLLHCYQNPACKDDDEECKTCSCPNCTTLPLLTECGICLEPLQGQGVRSCPVCANLTCRNCALRLTSCAFCRTTMPSQPNPALERLLDRLALPCKNYRWGCSELVEGDRRVLHEAECTHGAMSCPLGRGLCGWRGDLTHFSEHLQTVHELHPLSDHGIGVEIVGFRGKAFAKDGRQYTVCLSCYNRLYVVKIILFQGKLCLSFFQLGAESSRTPKPRYGVWLDVNSSSKSLKGVLPFGRKNCDTRQIEFTCDTLMSPVEKLDNDIVKINIVIKPITFL